MPSPSSYCAQGGTSLGHVEHKQEVSACFLALPEDLAKHGTAHTSP